MDLYHLFENCVLDQFQQVHDICINMYGISHMNRLCTWSN